MVLQNSTLLSNANIPVTTCFIYLSYNVEKSTRNLWTGISNAVHTEIFETTELLVEIIQAKSYLKHLY